MLEIIYIISIKLRFQKLKTGLNPGKTAFCLSNKMNNNNLYSNLEKFGVILAFCDRRQLILPCHKVNIDSHSNFDWSLSSIQLLKYVSIQYSWFCDIVYWTCTDWPLIDTYSWHKVVIQKQSFADWSRLFWNYLVNLPIWTKRTCSSFTNKPWIKHQRFWLTGKMCWRCLYFLLMVLD